MKNKKLIVKSVLSLSLVVLVMAVAIVAWSSTSYGWFAYNKTVNGSNMSVVSVDNPALLIDEYHIYKRDIENQAIIEVSNNVSGSDLYNADVSLNEYDTIIKERNVGTHIVISVVIGHIQRGGAIKVSLTNSNPIGESDQNNPLDPYLSNICSFRCKYGYETDEISTAFNSFTNSDTYYKFVTVTSNESSFTNVKASLIEMTITNYDDAIFAEDGVDKLRVYIEISYNEELVTSYLSQNKLSTDINDVSNSTIEFESDMQPFIFDYSTN